MHYLTCSFFFFAEIFQKFQFQFDFFFSFRKGFFVERQNPEAIFRRSRTPLDSLPEELVRLIDVVVPQLPPSQRSSKVKVRGGVFFSPKKKLFGSEKKEKDSEYLQLFS